MEIIKPTYEELEIQIAELIKQNEFLQLKSSFQYEEKEKRAAELIIAIIELGFRNDEIGKLAVELVIASIKVALKNEEKDKLAAELVIANLAIALQAKLIDANEMAEESNTLKTAFLQNLSHDIRTPMNAIIGFSEMLHNPELTPAEHKEFVTIIVNSCNQLLSIVNNVFTISSLGKKQEEVNAQKVNINKIMLELVAVFEVQAQAKNISFHSKQQLFLEQSEIYTDKTKLTQILSNLIANALKFTEKGFVEFGYSLKGNDIEFYVKDSGIGIKTEMFEKTFDRFSPADVSIHFNYIGSDLGFSISKLLVELLGGKIWVQSELGVGTTFYFTIPFNPVSDIKKAVSHIELSGKPVTVLVVDDEDVNFRLIKAILKNMNLNLIRARNGEEAFEISKANPEIALVLMDINMPIMNGDKSAVLIKEFRHDLPIIAQSAIDLAREKDKYQHIFDDFILKPISYTELIDKVNRYIQNKLNQDSNDGF